MNYKQEIDDIIKSNIINEPSIFVASDIFDYSDMPNEELFEQFYGFCRTNMDIHAQRLNISPNYFVYTNHFNSNAQAIRVNNEYFILIYMGLIKHSIDNLLNNERLDEYVNEKYPDLINNYDNAISGLGFQVATQFAYYHELAHLIQFSKKGEKFSLQEMYNTTSTFDIREHKLEINADTYAAIAITSHIQQYLEKTFGDSLTVEKAQNTFVLIGACLLNHISRFSGNNIDIYFDNYSHPHPFLRLFNVMLNIAHHLNHSPFLKSMNIQINAGGLLKEVFNFYEELEKEKIFNTNFGDILNKGEKVQNEIVQYLGELINFDIDQDYYDALEKWNEVFE